MQGNLNAFAELLQDRSQLFPQKELAVLIFDGHDAPFLQLESPLCVSPLRHNHLISKTKPSGCISLKETLHLVSERGVNVSNQDISDSPLIPSWVYINAIWCKGLKKRRVIRGPVI